MRAHTNPHRATSGVSDAVGKQSIRVAQDQGHGSGPEDLREFLGVRRPFQRTHSIPVGDESDQGLRVPPPLQRPDPISGLGRAGTPDPVHRLRGVRDEAATPNVIGDGHEAGVRVIPEIEYAHRAGLRQAGVPRADRIASATTRSTGRVTLRLVPPSSTIRIRPPAASTSAASSVAVSTPEA